MQTSIEVTGEAGTSTSCALTHHWPAGTDLGPARMSVVRFDDDWRRGPAIDGWTISRRVAHQRAQGLADPALSIE
jgi:hypothetical protein